MNRNQCTTQQPLIQKKKEVKFDMAHKLILTIVQIQNTLSDLQNPPWDTPTSS